MNMANYDLMGKHLGLPAWKLIGPKVRSWVPVAAWTVSQEPVAMAEEVVQAAGRGYHWMKYHVAEVHNVIDQTRAMQEVAPPGFRIHYDFNVNRDVYTMCPIILELEKFPVAGRIEDVIKATDEDGYRMLREKCSLPIIIHHGPVEAMIKNICDGYMSGHAAVGSAVKTSAIAEITRKPFMLQNAGGTLNQAFQAHQAAVFPMAAIDHVNLCHLWKEDVTCRWTHARLDPNLPGKGTAWFFHEQLHGFEVPGYVPSYDNPIDTDFWVEDEDPGEFEKMWQQTESGPAWVKT